MKGVARGVEVEAEAPARLAGRKAAGIPDRWSLGYPVRRRALGSNQGEGNWPPLAYFWFRPNAPFRFGVRNETCT